MTQQPIEQQELAVLEQMSREACRCIDDEQDVYEPDLEAWKAKGGCIVCWTHDGHSEECESCEGTGLKWSGFSQPCSGPTYIHHSQDCLRCHGSQRYTASVAEALKWGMEQPKFRRCVQMTQGNYSCWWADKFGYGDTPFLALAAAMREVE